MDADFHASQRDYQQRAVLNLGALLTLHRPEKHAAPMEEDYDKDFVAECLAQSVFRYFLLGDESKACSHAESVNRALLPSQAPKGVNASMQS